MMFNYFNNDMKLDLTSNHHFIFVANADKARDSAAIEETVTA